MIWGLRNRCPLLRCQLQGHGEPLVLLPKLASQTASTLGAQKALNKTRDCSAQDSGGGREVTIPQSSVATCGHVPQFP